MLVGKFSQPEEGGVKPLQPHLIIGCVFLSKGKFW
ncbi:hypothetical protein LYNGBM3L_63320 [Moorena producens 3L]|uniref:Uncharacterized protein n=1 Tax=Moorena producens 3L TaxID=489825 RepID=F4Y137_9CYAN|nr:hypothetical protein [Moorena producens 3L]EGJ29548.1 hypothetical protein LYNGBM3L_63320 [Moorena producens 3L]